MESFFEQRFLFSPANVDRFLNQKINAVEHYSKRRLQRRLAFIRVSAVVLGLTALTIMVALITRRFLFTFPLTVLTLILIGIAFRLVKDYYWFNFSLRVVSQFFRVEYTPDNEADSVERMVYGQIGSFFSVILALSFALIIPAPPPPPPPPTATPTPSMTYTPSQTYTPSATYTPSITPTPTITPTFVFFVDSPRPVTVRICPEVSCEVLSILDPGTQLVVMEDGEAWVQVRIPDGRVGFIASFLTTWGNPPTPLPDSTSSP